MRYALLGGEAREQDRRLPGDIGFRIPDMYIDTLLGLHYSEDITQVLRCLLEEKHIQRERRIFIRSRVTRLKIRGAIVSYNHKGPTKYLFAKERYATST